MKTETTVEIDGEQYAVRIYDSGEMVVAHDGHGQRYDVRELAPFAEVV